MGQVGAIRQLCVTEAHRDRGLGALLLERALESCARSLFRHVIAGEYSSTPDADRLLSRAGFGLIGQLHWMVRR